jgi:hypothetical protein
MSTFPFFLSRARPVSKKDSLAEQPSHSSQTVRYASTGGIRATPPAAGGLFHYPVMRIISASRERPSRFGAQVVGIAGRAQPLVQDSGVRKHDPDGGRTA